MVDSRSRNEGPAFPPPVVDFGNDVAAALAPVAVQAHLFLARGQDFSEEDRRRLEMIVRGVDHARHLIEEARKAHG